MVRFLMYLASLPHCGLLSHLLPAPSAYARPKSIDIDTVWWPTSLARGERPDGDEDGCEWA